MEQTEKITGEFILNRILERFHKNDKIIQKAARGVKLTKGEKSWFTRQINLKQ